MLAAQKSLCFFSSPHSPFCVNLIAALHITILFFFTVSSFDFHGGPLSQFRTLLLYSPFSISLLLFTSSGSWTGTKLSPESPSSICLAWQDLHELTAALMASKPINPSLTLLQAQVLLMQLLDGLCVQKSYNHLKLKMSKTSLFC